VLREHHVAGLAALYAVSCRSRSALTQYVSLALREGRLKITKELKES